MVTLLLQSRKINHTVGIISIDINVNLYRTFNIVLKGGYGMSLVKKAIVYLSVAALAAPIVASGGVGVVNAAVTGGAHEQSNENDKA